MVFLLLFIAEEGQQHLWLQAPSLFRPCAEPGRLYSLSAQGNISPEESNFAPLCLLTGKPWRSRLWPVYIMMCFSSMESIYLILQRDSILKRVSYILAVSGVGELGAWAHNGPSPRGASSSSSLCSHACHMASPLWVLIACCYWDMDLLGRGLRVRKINLHKVRESSSGWVGFYILHRVYLRPSLTIKPTGLRSPYLWADHQGVKSVLSAGDSPDLLIAKKHHHPLKAFGISV